MKLTMRRRGEGGRPQGSGWREMGTWGLAFLLACGLWLFVNVGERTSTRTVRVRLDLLNLPRGLVVTNRVADYVEIGVAGPGIVLSTVDPARLVASVDLGDVRPGRATYTLSPGDFSLPRNVEVARVNPSQVMVEVDRLSRRRLPVRIEWRGELRPGLRLVDSAAVPDRVQVVGPRRKLEEIDSVATRPLDLVQLDSGVTEIEATLEAPGGLVLLREREAVVRAVVDLDLTKRRFAGVTVVLRNAHQAWQVVPPVVDLVIQGPRGEIRSLELPADAVWIDATGFTGDQARAVTPGVVVPPGFEVLEIHPAAVRLVSKGSRQDGRE